MRFRGEILSKKFKFKLEAYHSIPIYCAIDDLETKILEFPMSDKTANTEQNKAEQDLNQQTSNVEQETQQEEQSVTQMPKDEEQRPAEAIVEDSQPGMDWQGYADELEKKLIAAEETIQAQKDSVLRAKADSDNVQRRAQAEVDKARKYALEKFAGELLSVVDNLERAIAAADGQNEEIKPFLEGVEMTQKSLLNTLEKFGIQPIDPQGEMFNPEQHQAMSMQENDELPANTVMAVMQKGYLINDRLLRPAMVMVSRGGSNKVDTQA